MSEVFELSPAKVELLKTDGNLLVLGGPGSGKTTIALLKAQVLFDANVLGRHQKILFLSFARATITRVVSQSESMIHRDARKALEINTYHGFMWNLLKSHGYLVNGHKNLQLLPPPEAAAKLAGFSGDDIRGKEKRRLFYEEGVLHFDMFSEVSKELVSRSQKLRKVLCNTYPVIILDEFQDTNENEWEFIKTLGTGSRLIALADLEQRIYEFRGADPARIKHFIETYQPTQFDFGKENNRSSGTDITDFGNDLLTGANKGKAYNDVVMKSYSYMKDVVHLPLKLELLQSISRLAKSDKKNWSIAVLFPTKSVMMSVSDFLETVQQTKKRRYSALEHEVLMEMAGPSLAAIFIARLMSGEEEKSAIKKNIILDFCEFLKGRKGGAKPPSQITLKLCEALEVYLETGKIRGKKRQELIEAIDEIVEKRLALTFKGIPGDDWLVVRSLLLESSNESIKQVGQDAKYLRLLRKGALLSAGLADLWRSNGNYNGASRLIANALTQEHFSLSSRLWSGVHLMTMHASKGKEFDEVIIYDGPNKFRDKILKRDSKGQALDKGQDILKLRVAVTRAMSKTTILTPAYDSCQLL